MHIPDWVPDAIFYQIFPERFCNGNPTNDPPNLEPWESRPTRENFFGGDLAGIIQKLDYIADMGFTALYLNPIFKAGTNHKYDTHDYLEIDPAFGDDVTFDDLIREAHKRHIRVVLDGVFNHCGDGFAPFKDVVHKGERSRYKDWFTIYNFPIASEPFPNYATCGGAHYLPRLNAHNPEVEAFIHKVALYWLERGIDGWRLDVPYEIHTNFWRRFRKVIKDKYPDAYLVGEEWRDPAAFLQGDTFDGTTHYLLKNLAFDFLIKHALTGDGFARALETLACQQPEGSEYGMLTLLGGHDTPRLLTECQGDEKLALLLYTFLLTMPGAPLVYYGDENGMVGANDPDCRRPMIWDETQWRGKIRQPLLRLLELRKQHACLRRGSTCVGYANDGVIAYDRTFDNDKLTVVLNGTRVPRSLCLPVSHPDGTLLTDKLCGDQFSVCGGRIEFSPMSPQKAWILSSQP